MRKAERESLRLHEYGLSLTQCEAHRLPLVRHIDVFGEGCWDCPAEGCDHHIHEFKKDEWWREDKQRNNRRGLRLVKESA